MSKSDKYHIQRVIVDQVRRALNLIPTSLLLLVLGVLYILIHIVPRIP